jgi:DNA-binding protein HU-beta
MDKSTERVQGRVSKREYVSRVARRAGVPVRVASAVYEAAIEELLSIVGSGDGLTLTGFGKFYPQEHKGHRVRFADNNGKSEIENYAVLKFSATRAVNRNVPIPATPPIAKKAKAAKTPKAAKASTVVET